MSTLRRFDPGTATKNLPQRDKSGMGEVLKSIMLDYENNRPRSTQVAMGPSGVGHPCDRKLVMDLSGLARESNDNPIFSMIGTALHSQFALMLEYDNAAHLANGEDAPWLIEQDLQIRPGGAVPRGSCDAYFIPTATVVDLKTQGSSGLTKISSKGPGDVYRAQVHTYAYGLEKLGYSPQTVCIYAFPRNPTYGLPFLYEAVTWSEPYDRQLAVDALDRADNLQIVARKLNAGQNIMKLQTVKAVPGECQFCPLKDMMDGRRRVCPDART